MIYFLSILLSFALVIANPFLTNADNVKPKYGGTLTFATHRDISTMNPLVRVSSHNEWTRRLMYEPLLEVDERGKIQPYLAESWSTSSDGKIYTFQLRNGVKFHNGQEMTAADVKFAMDYTLNPKNGASGRTRLRQVAGIEVAGKYTLRITLKNPTPQFIPTLATIQSFSVIPKESLAEGKRKPATFPPGTGAFRFVEWRSNQKLILARNEDYWRGKAYLDKVIIRPIPNATVRFIALRSGDVDLIVRVPSQWVHRLMKGSIKGLSYLEMLDTVRYRVQFNTTQPPFNDKKLRQAVAPALDQKELIQSSFFGLGQPTLQKYRKGDTWYFDEIPSVLHDMNKAKAFLKNSSYKGESIELATGNSTVNQSLASTIQAQLKRVGIKVKINPLESGASRQSARQGDFSFRVGASGTYFDPSDTYGRELACEPNLKRRINNLTGYCDPEMEALVKKAEREMNHKARRELFKQIVTKFTEDVPTIYFAAINRYYGMRDNVKGFTSIREGTYEWFGGGLSRTWLDR